ncbi:MAG: Zn-dependent hydrolase [Thermoprotei archaeon]|nr:MAG: Zn-dependent hydrolase [Thermoprotei archaeon]
MVTIRWHGHACFEIVSSDGTVIVIDPHDGGSIGIKPPNVRADVVLMTHDHFDHNAWHIVLKEGGEKYLMREGEFTIGNKYKVLGVKAYHDKYKGRRRGEVVMYRLEVDGISVLHVGDLGHILDPEVANKLRPIDILMVPVGGVFTVDAKEAYEVVKELEPKAAIPMHYWIRGINLPLAPVDNFLSIVDYEIVRLDSNVWSITKDELDLWETTKVVVFKEP